MFLPRKVLSDDDLNHGAKLLMYEVLSLNELRLGCIAENYYFMKLLNVKSERTIQNWLKQLKDKGYIKVNLKTRPNRRGQVRSIVPIGNLLQSEKNINKDLEEEMQKDYQENSEDWFTKYMKNLGVKVPKNWK